MTQLVVGSGDETVTLWSLPLGDFDIDGVEVSVSEPNAHVSEVHTDSIVAVCRRASSTVDMC